MDTFRPKSPIGREVNNFTRTKGETMSTEKPVISIGIHQQGKEHDFVSARIAANGKQVIIMSDDYSMMVYISIECAEALADTIYSMCREVRGDVEPETFSCSICRVTKNVDDDYFISDEGSVFCPDCHKTTESIARKAADMPSTHCNAG